MVEDFGSQPESRFTLENAKKTFKKPNQKLLRPKKHSESKMKGK